MTVVDVNVGMPAPPEGGTGSSYLLPLLFMLLGRAWPSQISMSFSMRPCVIVMPGTGCCSQPRELLGNVGESRDHVKGEHVECAGAVVSGRPG